MFGVGRLGSRQKKSTGAAALPTADLLVWYDASDAATITLTGSSVTDWDDKSGNGHHLSQANASLQPTLVSADQNGLDVVSCDTNDSMLTASIAHGIGTGDFTVIFALKKAADAFGVWQGLARIGTDNPNFYLSTGGNNHKPIIENSGETAFSTALTESTAYVITYARSAGSVTCFINGAADAGNPKTIAGSFADGVFKLGSADVASFFGGKLFEVVMYTAALTASDRQAAETYLMTKWGI